jgi:long-chain acyl-CoA synthetase
MWIMEKLHKDLDPKQFESLPQVINYIVKEHAELPAFSCFGKTLSYSEVDVLSSRFASYLQNETKLRVGDRIAIQLPNILQFPVVLYGALKAGIVVVNTNPLYTSNEMLHQFKDSNVKAIVILANFCDKLEKIIDQTEIETVIVTELGDLQSSGKRFLINNIAKYIKKLVPRYYLPSEEKFVKVMKSLPNFMQNPGSGTGDDVAVLLYTGGTTGLSKGAMLSHNNLIANMMQLRARCLLAIRDKVETIGAPLPLYHSYAFLLHCLAMPYAGNHNILITNPRDIDSLIKLFKSVTMNGFVGINTLYLALLRHKDLSNIDFSEMKFCGAGGMAMTTSVAEEWLEATGCEITEGYGLTECSPVVSVNIPGEVKLGTVGPAVPETELKVVDLQGNKLGPGEKGELWVRGPQVMLGYWEKPEATAEAITEDGWLKTGDFAEISIDKCVSIVDRKKDMILVSGFNVFPNEVEDWVSRHPGVLECAAIGVPNERTGESIKLFVVGKTGAIKDEDLLIHCREGLTPYKIPREIVFVTDLPKSNIGKILRRELRDN